jgi:hypothetical protein
MKRVIWGLAMLMLAMAPATVSAATHRIALLDSSINTREFFRLHYEDDSNGPCSKGTFLGREEYQRYFLGWKYVLDGEPSNTIAPLAGLGLPTGLAAYDYQVIHDADLTNGSLADFDILILSNDVSLDDAQDKAVQQWVIRGGRLIATYGSGYKDIITDPKQDDLLKLQSGGTSGIHQLWHDPLTKAFGTQAITPEDPKLPGIRIGITTIMNPGPTAGFGTGIMAYGAEANLLVQRQENFKDALAFLVFDPPESWTRSQPAILVTKASRGQVVYLAFAPEFIVSLAFDLAGHCSGDGSYPPLSIAHQPGPDTPDFGNEFVGDITKSGNVWTQVNVNRVKPLMQLMKNTIDYMLSTF